MVLFAATLCIRASDTLTFCHLDRLRRSGATKEEWRDPEKSFLHHADSGNFNPPFLGHPVMLVLKKRGSILAKSSCDFRAPCGQCLVSLLIPVRSLRSVLRGVVPLRPSRRFR